MRAISPTIKTTIDFIIIELDKNEKNKKGRCVLPFLYGNSF
jgi:hypothetical protein